MKTFNIRLESFGRAWERSSHASETLVSDALAHAESWPNASLQYSAGKWLVLVSGIKASSQEIEEELRGLMAARLIGHVHDNSNVTCVLADGGDLTARVASTLVEAGLPASAGYDRCNPWPVTRRRVIHLNGRSYQLI